MTYNVNIVNGSTYQVTNDKDIDNSLIKISSSDMDDYYELSILSYDGKSRNINKSHIRMDYLSALNVMRNVDLYLL